MRVTKINRRIDNVEELMGLEGRYIVLEGHDQSDEQISEILKNQNITTNPNDYIVTVRKYSDRTTSEPRVLRVVNLDGSTPYVSKEQRDAAVRAALRADT